MFFKSFGFICLCSAIMSALPAAGEGLASGSEASQTALPPELAEALQRFEARREEALRPLRERLMREIDTAVSRLLAAGRPNDALALQRFRDEASRSGEVPDPPPQSPVELMSVFTNYSVARDNALRPLQQALEQELAQLQSAYIRRGDAASATVVGAILDNVRQPPLKPDPINWEKERVQVRYQYEHQRFYHGKFDYSDRLCRKLIDSRTGSIPSEDTVGWSQVPPPRIRVEFPRPVTPQEISIFMHGGGQWNMAVSREIKIYAGSPFPMAGLVGQSARHEDKTGWIRIPLKVRRPEKVFWIELSPSSTGLVLLDEMAWR